MGVVASGPVTEGAFNVMKFPQIRQGDVCVEEANRVFIAV